MISRLGSLLERVPGSSSTRWRCSCSRSWAGIITSGERGRPHLLWITTTASKHGWRPKSVLGGSYVPIPLFQFAQFIRIQRILSHLTLLIIRLTISTLGEVPVVSTSTTLSPPPLGISTGSSLFFCGCLCNIRLNFGKCLRPLVSFVGFPVLLAEVNDIL